MKVVYIFVPVVSIGLIILAVIYWFSDKEPRLTSQQKQTAMERLLGRQPILSTNHHQNDWIMHTSKYVSFSYPAMAQIYHDTVNPPDKNSLETFMFESENPKYFFGVEVLQPNDVKTYNDIPGVLMKRNNGKVYSETSMKYHNLSIPLFTKQQDNDIEKTTYILLNNKEYTFSITSANPDTMRIFDRVMGSVKINN